MRQTESGGQMPKGKNEVKRILITGAGAPAGINVIQSLRQATGYYLVGVDTCRERLVLSGADANYQVPRTDNPDYLPAIWKIIDAEKTDFFWPQPDRDVLWAAVHAAELPLTFLPPADMIRRCQDKYELLRMHTARKVHRVKTLACIDKAFCEMGLPLWMRATYGAGGRGSTKVASRLMATSWLAYWQSRGDDIEFMAEEYLPGRNIAWESIWHNGTLICSQARERLEYVYDHAAPSGVTGSSTISRTIDAPDVDAEGMRVVQSLMREPHGIFSVDLKSDKDGKPQVTEVNAGRLFTMSMLLTETGCNFADIHLRLAFGREIPEVRQFGACEPGLYWIRHMDAPGRVVREREFPPCC